MRSRRGDRRRQIGPITAAIIAMMGAPVAHGAGPGIVSTPIKSLEASAKSLIAVRRGSAGDFSSTTEASDADSVAAFCRRDPEEEKLGKSDRVLALTRVASACVREGELVRGLAVFSEIIGIDPTNEQAYINRGTIYVKLGMVDEGVADYSQAISLNPEEANAWYNRGTALLSGHDLDRAIRDLTQAVRLNPNLARAYCNRGFAYQKKLHYENALKDLSIGIILDGGIAFCYFTRGDLHFQRGKYCQAIEDLSRGLELKPEIAAALSQRARAYEHIGDRDKALKDYEAALKILKSQKRNQATRQKTPRSDFGVGGPQ